MNRGNRARANDPATFPSRTRTPIAHVRTYPSLSCDRVCANSRLCVSRTAVIAVHLPCTNIVVVVDFPAKVSSFLSSISMVNWRATVTDRIAYVRHRYAMFWLKRESWVGLRLCNWEETKETGVAFFARDKVDCGICFY